MIEKNYVRKYKMKNNSTAHSFEAMVWVLEINEISKKLGHHSMHKIKIQNNLRSITKKTIMCSRSAITKDCDMKKTKSNIKFEWTKNKAEHNRIRISIIELYIS